MAPAHSRLSEKVNLHFVILDWTTDEPDEYDVPPTHHSKTGMVAKLVTNHFDCELHKATFAKSDKPADVFQYFRDLFHNLGDDDALLIYYHGDAADCGKDYEWQFESGPRRPINAFDLIQLFFDSGLNISLALDCWMPDRFETRWVPRSDGKGNVEIMARGGRVQTFKGKAKEGHKSDFTSNLVKSIDHFVVNIDKPYSEGGYRSSRAPKSFSQLMATNKAMCSNPIKIFDRQTRAGDKVPIARFCILPSDVRKQCKISFRMKTIQEGKKSNEVDTEPDTLFVTADPKDEGYEEGTDDGADEGAQEQQKHDPNQLQLSAPL